MNLASAATLLPTAAAFAGLASYSVHQHRTCSALEDKVVQLEGQAAQSEVSLRERRELDSVKDEFISTVSHELRTPLTSIRGALGLLSAGLMGKVDDRAANLLRIASSNTDRLVRLINDILDLERMSSGSAPLQLHNCSVRDLILQSVDTMTAMANEAKVSLMVVQEPGNPAQLCEVDPDRLQQVFTNLLSNAIKFSPAGSTVCLEIESRGRELHISVRDAGRGVPTAKLESIFERFQQVEAADSRKKGGTGLGLAICRSIMQQHGGHIWAERNDARKHGDPGTTFRLSLTRLAVQTSFSPTAAQLPIPAAVPVPVAKASPRDGAVLVVDDDPSVRELVAENLRAEGYKVFETESGQTALSIAAEMHLAAILLDLYMPGMTGWETIERLKANAATASIPVIILSVLSPQGRHGSGPSLAGTTDGWIQKPFSPSRLVAELSRILQRGQGPARVLLAGGDGALHETVLSGAVKQAAGQELHVDMATDLQHAIAICERTVPEVLLLDLDLPEGAAFSLVSWLRRQPALCMLPLIVFCARDVSEEEREQLRLGPTHFLTAGRPQPEAVGTLVSAMVPSRQASSMAHLSA